VVIVKNRSTPELPSAGRIVARSKREVGLVVPADKMSKAQIGGWSYNLAVLNVERCGLLAQAVWPPDRVSEYKKGELRALTQRKPGQGICL
jgi:hypothetical protein